MMLFSSFGTETDRQLRWPVWQVTVTVAGRFALKTAPFCMATTPAGCGRVVMPQPVVQGAPGAPGAGGGVLPNGAPIVVNSGPAEAVLVLKAIVLLMMFTATESVREIPAPSQPATLSVMISLVTVTVFHCLARVYRPQRANTSLSRYWCGRGLCRVV